ncbi:THUMP-like domain-containing protein [Robertkochia sediminum]|uniref:THUMP-like domain-containing protein n=1 Tax=Robertkochia sediminum TaxID=2785326 RepID=UPI001933C1DC|nr:class I SAM-dependent methyltransferase [Robertkochia sediminum]MBL7474078.1 class I SAM-dependent methyltransferase [Robertkochia sediminum]
MNHEILNSRVQEFINENLHTDIASLVLKGSPFEGITPAALAEQVYAKRKSEKKLPTWFHTGNIYYPPVLSIEQTSSEITAKYKSGLFSGDHITDITGGFGVDDYYFSKRFSRVVHCELNKELSEIVRHNFEQLKASNISCHAGDGLSFVETIAHTDLIYTDPARRDDAKGKVFLLSDCTPNIVVHQDALFKKTGTIMIKTSPLLDLSAGIAELDKVVAIHIVAVRNEVKELLWILEREPVSKDITITAVNLNEHGTEHAPFEFQLGEITTAIARIGPVTKYLYEPNAAIMKSGAFNLIGEKFGLDKLHPHTHLYTGDTLVDFPGRRFEVLEVLPYNNKVMKKKLGGSQCHITTRNFPVAVANLRKKFKIGDGGDRYVFFCMGPEGQKQVIMTKKA